MSAKRALEGRPPTQKRGLESTYLSLVLASVKETMEEKDSPAAACQVNQDVPGAGNELGVQDRIVLINTRRQTSLDAAAR